jgi:probable aminopeptidase NPEPL1
VYETVPPGQTVAHVDVLVDTLVHVPADVAAAAAAAAGGVRLAARLVDTTPAVMDPDQLVAEAEAVVAALNGGVGRGECVVTGDCVVTSNILRYDALKAAGFGGLVAVGDAAARDGREPALVHLTYTPSTADSDSTSASDSPGPCLRKVALVGKGITFDTGGLQIKGRAGMPGMKTDMGGAAAMLAAFHALVSLYELPTRRVDSNGQKLVTRPANLELHLVLCIAENAVGPGAFRPDDVITQFSGRTVEINNTDAEGRVVLADGVAYASGPLNCDDVIDMATLTGAQMVATGRRFAGIVSDDEAMESAAVRAGRLSGDLVHALPYAPEFFSKEFGSKIADMRNSVKDRSNAQASCAGQFIADHLDAGWKKQANQSGAKNKSEDEEEDEDGDGDGDDDGRSVVEGGAARWGCTS